jgi:acyl carrier protein
LGKSSSFYPNRGDESRKRGRAPAVDDKNRLNSPSNLWPVVGTRNALEVTSKLAGQPESIGSFRIASKIRSLKILRADILGWIYDAIDDVNAQSADDRSLEKTPETRLLGGENGIDSLTFVNLVVALEEQIQVQTGNSVVLVDENSMASQEHPFQTVGTLAEYVKRVLAKPRTN